MNELIEAINQGWNVQFERVCKRMEGDDGWRDFFIRIAYKAVKLKTINDPTSYIDKIESEWEGFETAEEAVNDLIEKLKPKLKK